MNKYIFKFRQIHFNTETSTFQIQQSLFFNLLLPTSPTTPHQLKLLFCCKFTQIDFKILTNTFLSLDKYLFILRQIPFNFNEICSLIAKVCFAHCSTSRLALHRFTRLSFVVVCHHAQNTTLWCFRPYKPYIFWKL